MGKRGLSNTGPPGAYNPGILTKETGASAMTRQQMYRELERLYAQVDWSNKDSIRAYNEKARQYRKMVEEEEDDE